MSEDKKFGDGYEAIFGKPATGAAGKAAKKPVAKKKPAAKKPTKKKS
jgi:hypothetical protein